MQPWKESLESAPAKSPWKAPLKELWASTPVGGRPSVVTQRWHQCRLLPPRVLPLPFSLSTSSHFPAPAPTGSHSWAPVVLCTIHLFSSVCPTFSSLSAKIKTHPFQTPMWCGTEPTGILLTGHDTLATSNLLCPRDDTSAPKISELSKEGN